MPQLLGLPVVFPDYADTSGAIQRVLPFQSFSTGPSALATYTASGHFIDVPLAVYALVRTSNNAGARSLFLFILDNTGNIIATIPAAATQAASNDNNYTWLWTVATPFALSSTQIAPMTPTLLPPGYTLEIEIANGPVGNTDSFVSASISMLSVPTTASANTPAPEPLIATPVVF